MSCSLLCFSPASFFCIIVKFPFLTYLCSKWHNILGIYVCLGNLGLAQRQLDVNMDVLGLLGPHWSFYDALECHVESLLQLQKGVKMNVLGKPHWVVGGLGIIAADWPMGEICKYC
jgi:hypothetical protein